MEFQRKTSPNETRDENRQDSLPSKMDSEPSTHSKITSNSKHRLGEPSPASKILVVLLIISSIVFITAMSLQLVDSFSEKEPILTYDVDKTYLIKLDNDDVFAGKLTKINDNFFLLKESFEISTINDQPMAVKPSDAKYGADDTLYIDSADVTYWQAIPDDSVLGRLIKNYKSTNVNGEDKTMQSQSDNTKPAATPSAQPESNTPVDSSADRPASPSKPQTTPTAPNPSNNNNDQNADPSNGLNNQ